MPAVQIPMFAVGGVLAVAEFLAATDLNTYVNVFTLALIVLAAIPVARSRRDKQTIKELTDALEAKDKRLVESLASQRQLEQGCQHLKTDAAKWQARYEEQSKYTAAEAVLHFEQVMEEHRQQVAERHAALLHQGAQTAELLQGIVETLHRIEAA